jgi:hypothetical protein
VTRESRERENSVRRRQESRSGERSPRGKEEGRLLRAAAWASK